MFVIPLLTGCSKTNDENYFIKNLNNSELPYNVINTTQDKEQLDTVYLKNKARLKRLYDYFETKYGGYSTYIDRDAGGGGSSRTVSSKPNQIFLAQQKLSELYGLNEMYYNNSNLAGVSAVTDFVVKVKGN